MTAGTRPKLIQNGIVHEQPPLEKGHVYIFRNFDPKEMLAIDWQAKGQPMTLVWPARVLTLRIAT